MVILPIGRSEETTKNGTVKLFKGSDCAVYYLCRCQKSKKLQGYQPYGRYTLVLLNS